METFELRNILTSEPETLRKRIQSRKVLYSGTGNQCFANSFMV